MTSEQQSSKSTAKDVFSYLLMIIVLIIGVVSFSAILWQYINFSFPDPLEMYYSGLFDIIKNSISSLIVAWPVFLFLSWSTGRDLKRNESKKHIWIRRWLLHLMLFAASITIIIDLITLINSFLSGELTTRFFLKVLVILVVAVTVFVYYLWDLRRNPTKRTPIPRVGAIATSVVILLAFVAGFFVVGSPAHQRDIRMDENRISDLQSIQYQVLFYWQQKDSLPESLDSLNDPLYGYEVPIDPITDEAYRYSVEDDLSFSLCATFSTSSDERGNEYQYVERSPYPVVGDTFTDWTHDVGEHCFDRTIDPELHSTNEVIPKALIR